MSRTGHRYKEQRAKGRKAVRLVCVTGKRAFPSASAAMSRAMNIASGGSARAVVPCRAYRCEHCGQFHLTSRPVPRSTFRVPH